MEFKIGDTAFLACCGSRSVEKPCPICFGKRKVTVILGDETAIETPCDFCGLGNPFSRGVVTEYESTARVEPVVITSVRATESTEGRCIEYGGLNGYVYHPEDLFSDEAAAMARAEEKQKEYQASADERSDAGQKHCRQKLSWSVGYHRREAARNRKDAEYHEGRAVICQARIRKS